MSQDHRTILKRAIENFNHPDTRSRYFDLYDENCVLSAYPGVEPGLSGIKQFYEETFTAFPDCQVTIDETLADGDTLACRFTFRGTHKGEFMGIPPTDKQVTMLGMTTLRFVGDKWVERWGVADMLSLMQQIGAVPSE